MHYSNGREAKIGDLVRGKGYNYKHEIIGILIGTVPGTDTCNCTIATVGIRKDSPPQLMLDGWIKDGVIQTSSYVPRVFPSNEYGQLDAFLAIDPETGEVLPGPSAA